MLRAVVRHAGWLLMVPVVACSAPPPPRTTAGAADAGRSRPARDAAEAPADVAPAEPVVEAGDDRTSTPIPAPVPDDAAATSVPPADAPAPADAGTSAAAAADGGRTPPPVERPVTDGTAVVHRVGCDPITRAQVDGQLRLLAAWEGRAIDPAVVPDDDPLRAETLQVLIDQRIVEREARSLGLTVEAWELQQAVLALAQRMGGEPAQVFGMFQQLGVDMADVEQALGAQVLAYKVALAISERQGVHATDEQVAAEYAARTAGLDPSMIRPLEQASAGLREELEFKLRIEAGRAWVIEQRTAVEQLRTRTTGGRCVELPVAGTPPAS